MAIVFNEVKGREVVAEEAIKKGEYICEYRYTRSHGAKDTIHCVCEYRYTRKYPVSKRKEMDSVYERNGEGCYVLEVVIEGRKMCLDATISLTSFGRYINHIPSKKANVKMHPPLFVRGKWRVAFLATQDISVGSELGYDYGQEGMIPDWMRRRCVSWRA